MKQTKHILLMAAMLLCSLAANAHDFEVGGIYYNIISESDLAVEVTYGRTQYDRILNAYKGTVIIPELVEYEGNTYRVTEIGDEAFESCAGVTSITIPDGVTTIGSNAFSYCLRLTSIIIPKSVTSIADDAFSYSSIKEVVLEPTTPPAFSYESYESYYVPSHTLFIVPTSSFEDYLSAWTWSLKNQITVADVEARIKVVKITASEDMDYTSALSLAIGEESLRYVTHLTISGPINGNDFYVMCRDMPLLRHLDLSKAKIVSGGRYDDYVTEENIFPEEGLEDCNLLTLVLPESITSIGNYAISGNENLSEITIPESVTTIGHSVFNNCSSLLKIYCYAKEVPAMGYFNGNLLDIEDVALYVLPEVIDAYKSAETWQDFGGILLLGMETITSVNQLSNDKVYWISPSYDEKGVSAWVVQEGGVSLKSCHDLQIKRDIYDPRQQFAFISNDGGKNHYLYHVAEEKFVDKRGLLTEIPLTPVYFTEGAYDNTFVVYFDSLHYINVGGSQEMTIDKWSLADGGNSCSFVPVAKFDPTAALAMIDKWSVRPEEGVAYRALGNGEAELVLASTSLKEIAIPETATIDGKECKVTSIGDCAFSGCAELVSVTFPEGVKEIGVAAFYDCSAIKNITLPESMTMIGDYAFQYCYSLTSFKSPRTTKMGGEVFKGCENLEYLTLNSSYIKASEFKRYRNLKEVVLGDNVTSIGENAFMNCESLAAITISGSVKTIENNAFTDCISLKEVTIEDGSEPLSLGYVTGNRRFELDGEPWRAEYVGLFFDSPLEKVYLGRDLKYAHPNNLPSSYYYHLEPYQTLFFNQTNLTSVTIGNTVTEVSEYAFYNCSNLIEVHINDIAAWCNINFESAQSNPISIAKNLYLNGELVTELTIPEGVTEIGNYAFYNCQSISSVNFPETITKIGTDAFYGIPILSKFSNGVVYIGKVLYTYKGDMPENTSIKVKGGTVCVDDCAFAEQNNLVSITFPESVTEIGYGAFRGCSGLSTISISENSQLTSIGDEAFYGCSDLTAIHIPESVTEIGYGAFRGCSGLSTISIPENSQLTSIGDEAFSGCSSLTTITLPKSEIIEVGDYAFSGCSNLTSFDAGNAEYFRDSTFDGCNSLERVALNCRTIGDWFNNNTSIKEVVLGDRVVGSSTLPAFSGCASLERVTINSTDATGLFRNTSIKEVVLGDGVTMVKDNAFERCSGLTDISIPASVTSIGNYAFRDCSGLTSITIGKNVMTIGDPTNTRGSAVFDNCTSLKEVVFEDGSETLAVGYNAYGPRPVNGRQGLFFDCPLEKVYLGRNLNYDTRVQAGYSPFYNKGTLTSLTIGSEVTEIGEKAFYGCNAIDTITCHAMTPPTCASDAFSGVDTSIPVYVPEASVADYQTAEVWKDFLNFIGTETGIEHSEIRTQDSEVIFDLQGRRVLDTENLRGLYIVNGRKVVIK